MRIFKTTSFAKEAILQGLSDGALRSAIDEFKQGLTGDALGGNLFKKRIAIGSKGKSGGLRTILVYKLSTDKVFCIFLFAKNKRDNIVSTELKALKRLGKVLLELNDKQIEEAVAKKKLLEI